MAADDLTEHLPDAPPTAAPPADDLTTPVPAAAPVPGPTDPTLTQRPDPPGPKTVARNSTLAYTPPARTHAHPPDAPAVPGYEILRKLGEGTYGEVWQARDPAGIDVAIKFFHRGADQQWLLMQAEVRLLASLQTDPGIIQLRDVQPDAQPPHYVMSYAEGGCLGQRLKNGPLPLAVALPIFRQVVTTLAYVHSKGTRHCDLKPGNVLLDARGRARVADFGQAHLSDDATPALGTFFYMAPEQADLNQKVADTRWDVYGLGALFYAMVTGEPPRKDPCIREELANTAALTHRLRRYREWVAAAPPPRDHRRVKGMDRHLAGVIDRCLSVDPARRFRSAGSLLAALDWRERRLRQRPFLITSLVAPILVLVLLSVLGYWGAESTLRGSRAALVTSLGQSNQVSATLVAYKVQEQLAARVRPLESAAAEPLIRQALQARDRPALAAQMKLLYEQSNPPGGPGNEATQIHRWAVFAAGGADHGKILALHPPDARADLFQTNFSFRDYFSGHGDQLNARAAVHDPIRAVHISQPFVGRASGDGMLVGLSAPVLDPTGTHAVGVLLTTVPLDRLNHWLQDVQFDNGFAVLVNSRHHVLRHQLKDRIQPQRDTNPTEFDNTLYRVAFTGAGAGYATYADPVDDGREYVAGYARLKGGPPFDDWAVLVQHDRAAVEQPVNALREQMTSWGLFMLASAVVLLAGIWTGLYLMLRREAVVEHG